MFSSEYEANFKGKRTEIPHYLIVGGALRFFFCCCRAKGTRLFDSMKRFSGLRESCERAQQLNYIPNHQDCKCKRGGVPHTTFKQSEGFYL